MRLRVAMASFTHNLPQGKNTMALPLSLGIALAAMLATPMLHAATAYVSNEGSGTVSIVDTATDQVTATGRFGTKPRGIAIAPDGARLYLSDQKANALVVVDTAKREAIATVPLGDSPEAI